MMRFGQEHFAREGIGHGYFAAAKFRDPASRRRAPAFESPTYSLPGCTPLRKSENRPRRFRFAEREGFEPSVRFYPHSKLATCRFQPLTHLSFVHAANLGTLSNSAVLRER